VNMRTQLARLGVDDRELLFDSQSERVVLHAMPGRKTSVYFADLHRLFVKRIRSCLQSVEICVIRG
jgi:hypothetical protein